MPKSYTFKELLAAAENPNSDVTSRAVDKARDWHIQGLDYEWWECTYEMWEKALDQIGFTDAKINFSGFCSQGDGASFVSSVDVERLTAFMSTGFKAVPVIKALKKKLYGHNEDFRSWIVHKIGGFTPDVQYKFIGWVAEYICASVKRQQSNYPHENSCRFCLEYNEIWDHPILHGWFETPKDFDTLVYKWEKDAEELRRDLCHAIYSCLEQEYEYLTSDECLSESDHKFDAEGEWI